MNIFVVDRDPVLAAEMLCDKHVNSQIRESAQMLCAAFEAGRAPMKRTHYNHPCTKWARETFSNWMWLLRHAHALCEEYSRWTLKDHQCAHHLDWCRTHRIELDIPNGSLTEFAQAMPDKYKIPGDAVTAYRAYYCAEKRSFARWSRRASPYWFHQEKADDH